MSERDVKAEYDELVESISKAMRADGGIDHTSVAFYLGVSMAILSEALEQLSSQRLLADQLEQLVDDLTKM